LSRGLCALQLLATRVFDFFTDVCEGMCRWLRNAGVFAFVCELGLMSSPPVSRIFYLDAIRAFLMLFGVLTHATMIGSSVFFEAVVTVSGLFRMKAFF
jgi:hypothetical protein